MKTRLFVLVFLFVAAFWGGVRASVEELQGTWYGEDRVMEIWWCAETQAWRFEVRSSDMSSVLASGTVEESAGMSGSTYVFVTEDSRIFQADYDGSCSLSVGQLGTFMRAECSGGGGSPDGTGFDPCADAGVSWDNEQQPGMYVYFYGYYSQCNYELYVQGQLVDSGTVQVQGNRLVFTSQSGSTTEGYVMDACSFSWGEAGVFRKEDCGGSDEWEGGSGDTVISLPPGCEPFSHVVPGPLGGQLSFEGGLCRDQGSLMGTVRYENFTLPAGMMGSMTVNGEVQLYVEVSAYQWYWIINGGPIYYSLPGYRTFEVYFDNVQFLNDMYNRPLQAAGTLYVNGQPYPVTPDLFHVIFGM